MAMATFTAQGSPSPSVQVSGKGFLLKHRGLWVMSLHGTRVEMARQHGELARPLIQETALPYFAEKIQMGLAQAYILRDSALLRGTVRAFLDLTLTFPLMGKIPSSDRKMLEAFADGAKIPHSMIKRGFVVPDIGQILIGRVFGKNRLLKGHLGPAPSFGCSSFVSVHADGIIHGRNLDYEGFGVFEKHAMVTYFHSTEPGDRKVMAIHSLGLPNAGITATNDAGITFGIHQMMVDRTTPLGRPILSIMDEMIRKVSSIEEAISFLKAQKFTSVWTVVLSSHRERRAVTIEVGPSQLFVREMTNQPLFNSNHVFSPELKKDEVAMNPRYYWDSLERYKSMTAHAQAKNLKDVQSVIDIISDPAHDSRKTSLHFGSTDRMNNVQSVVFDTDEKIAWVAHAERGTFSKPLHGSLVPFPISFDTTATAEDLQKALERMPQNRRTSWEIPEDRVQAEAHYRKAAQKIVDEGNFQEGLAELNRASQLQPKDSYYPLMSAFTLFKMAGIDSQQRPSLLEDARSHLEEAESRGGLHPYHQELVHLFRGRYFDLKKDRRTAQEHYKQVNPMSSRALKDALKDVHWKAYEPHQLKKLAIDYTMGDFFVL